MSSSPLMMAIHEYGKYHQTTVNRCFHVFGIPAIAIGLLGLLTLVGTAGELPRLVRPNLGWIAILAYAFWYLSRDVRFGLVVLVGILGCYAIGSLLNLYVLGGLFVAGAICHVIGHFGFEHKPPTFFSHPSSLFSGPAWLVAYCFQMI